MKRIFRATGRGVSLGPSPPGVRVDIIEQTENSVTWEETEMLSFDRAQQRHDANTEPPEPRICADGEHEPDGRTLKVSDEDMPNCIVSVECEKCGLTGWYEPLPSDWYDWGEL